MLFLCLEWVSLPPPAMRFSGPAPVPRAGHTLGPGLVGSPALGQEQQCLVKTWNKRPLRGGLSSSESSEDFFAGLENEHHRVSMSSLFYSTTNCPQSFWTDCLHYYLKVQVQQTEK